MSDAYWKIWNDAEQSRIDADIDANRKANFEVKVVDRNQGTLAAGTEVKVEQCKQAFRFGAHIFNFNQLGKREYNDLYQAGFGSDGIFNQATVAFYWNAYEPIPNALRNSGSYEDSRHYWYALSSEAARYDPYWRRPSPGPVIAFLKKRDVAVHGHVLIWQCTNPDWIYAWCCPESEKRYLDALGVPRHAASNQVLPAGAEVNHGYRVHWVEAWRRIATQMTEEEIAMKVPVFTARMRQLYRKHVFDVAQAFGPYVDSWDVVNECSKDWTNIYRKRPGLPVWFSHDYGLMPGDFPLRSLLDAKEAMPAEAKLAINDNNVSGDFATQVEDLLHAGAKVDIVGCQMHIFETNACSALSKGDKGVSWIGTPGEIQSRLDIMARAGRPVHISEVTIPSPGTDATSLQIQAILARNIYRKWFSHKAVMGITWWNTVDGAGAFGEPLTSGIYTREMKKKPVYHALEELVKNEWRTTLSVKVDPDGKVRFRGFYGMYRISWKCPQTGKRDERIVWLTNEKEAD